MEWDGAQDLRTRFSQEDGVHKKKYRRVREVIILGSVEPNYLYNQKNAQIIDRRDELSLEEVPSLV